jgi:phosphoglycerate dehydrogenase-like enzyme
MTPHHAGMMPEVIINGLIMAVENVEAFLAGKEINSAHLVIKGKR